MPLHDFICTACETRFEWLTRAGEDARCPSCDATAVERLLSAFAVRSTGARSAPAAAAMPPIPAG